MDIFYAILFNGVWLLGTLIFGALLCLLFSLVEFPPILEILVIGGNSLFVGMLLMFLTISRIMGKSWEECGSETRGSLEMGYPIWKGSGVALAVSFVLHWLAADPILNTFVAAIVGVVVYWLGFIKVNRKYEQKH